MAFKTATSDESVPDSPDKLFRDLTRRKFPDVLPHQAETMQAYAAEGVSPSDVALQLPTGSGKTLVGLLIAEWRRRKFNERVVYLCPKKSMGCRSAPLSVDNATTRRHPKQISSKPRRWPLRLPAVRPGAHRRVFVALSAALSGRRGTMNSSVQQPDKSEMARQRRPRGAAPTNDRPGARRGDGWLHAGKTPAPDSAVFRQCGNCRSDFFDRVVEVRRDTITGPRADTMKPSAAIFCSTTPASAITMAVFRCQSVARPRRSRACGCRTRAG